MSLRVVIINKSDSTGGAAVVSRRLLEALRDCGVDARMLVAEKLTDSPFIALAASPIEIKERFMSERLAIFIENGFDRKTLFKIDTATKGLSLWKHPWVRDADAVLLNWVNQGLLSLKGIEKIIGTGKPVIWTMHDLWCMTGICHHPAQCDHYRKSCGDCFLLGKRQGPHDLSSKIWKRKSLLYGPRESSSGKNLKFVAVSRWLAEKAAQSSLLGQKTVSVIPNPFDFGKSRNVEDLIGEEGKTRKERKTGEEGKIKVLFGAARLDDPVKGFPVLIELTRLLNSQYSDLASRLELVTFGDIKDTALFSQLAIKHTHLGRIYGEEKIAEIYRDCQIVLSSSSYETLPGTLVEGQAFGCIPVSFNQGGQGDIIDHLSTGYIAEYNQDVKTAARNLAEGLAWADGIISNREAHLQIIGRMRERAIEKFDSANVARRYIALIQSMIPQSNLNEKKI